MAEKILITLKSDAYCYLHFSLLHFPYTERSQTARSLRRWRGDGEYTSCVADRLSVPFPSDGFTRGPSGPRRGIVAQAA